MCDRCYQRAAIMLAAILSQPMPTMPDQHSPTQFQAAALSAEAVAGVLKQLIPSLAEDGPEIDQGKMFGLLRDLGGNRIAGLVNMCGYFRALLDDVNRIGVAAMEGMAKAGDKRAQGWFRENAQHVVELEMARPADTSAVQGKETPVLPFSPPPRGLSS